MSQEDVVSALQGQYVQANGLDVYYEEVGAGAPLILLHGGTVTSARWQPQLPAFARHFRVITPDSRGHGRTNNPAGALGYRLMADDVAALVQALGLDAPLICGYSDGGQIALEIGMRYPDLATALVVGAAWYRMTDGYLDSLRAFGLESPGEVDFQRMQQESADLVAFWTASHRRDDDPECWKTLLMQISVMWWTPLGYTPEDFRRITTPMLILVGDRDEFVDVEQAIEMYRLIPKAELAVVPDPESPTGASETDPAWQTGPVARSFQIFPLEFQLCV